MLRKTFQSQEYESHEYVITLLFIFKMVKRTSPRETDRTSRREATEYNGESNNDVVNDNYPGGSF